MFPPVLPEPIQHDPVNESLPQNNDLNQYDERQLYTPVAQSAIIHIPHETHPINESILVPQPTIFQHSANATIAHPPLTHQEQPELMKHFFQCLFSF